MDFLNDRLVGGGAVLGRLKPGVSPKQATDNQGESLVQLLYELCLFRWIFFEWWFRDLPRFFVKNVAQMVVFGVVKMDMLW